VAPERAEHVAALAGGADPGEGGLGAEALDGAADLEDRGAVPVGRGRVRLRRRHRGASDSSVRTTRSRVSSRARTTSSWTAMTTGGPSGTYRQLRREVTRVRAVWIAAR